eukprot:gene27592-7228_t
MNQQLVVEQAVAMVASQMERQLEEEMNRLDNLGESDLATIRKQRVLAMKKRQEKTKEWLARGHGEYNEIATEKEFFNEMKGEERMICHFYRENWPCKVMDKHLSLLAPKHVETKIIKINAEKCPFLTDRLKIWMLPTLALIKNGKVEDYIVGLDPMGGEDFATEVLSDRLLMADIIEADPSQRLAAAAAGAHQSSIRKGGSSFQKTGSDEDSDFDD